MRVCECRSVKSAVGWLVKGEGKWRTRECAKESSRLFERLRLLQKLGIAMKLVTLWASNLAPLVLISKH